MENLEISEIAKKTIGEISSQDSRALMFLSHKAVEYFNHAKKVKQWIDSAIDIKYSDTINRERLKLNKDSGVINIEDGGVKITHNLVKKTDWDQEKLAEIYDIITKQGQDPEEYIDIIYKVSERKYNAWPKSIRELFTDARTLKFGKPTYTFSPDNEGDA